MSIAVRPLTNAGILINRNGAGSGSTLLDGTYRGSTYACPGIDAFKLRVVVGFGGATAINVRVRDASPSGNATIAADTFPWLVTRQSGPSGNGSQGTVSVFASTDTGQPADIITVNLDGTCSLVAIEVSATGGALTSSDTVLVEFSFAEG